MEKIQPNPSSIPTTKATSGPPIPGVFWNSGALCARMEYQSLEPTDDERVDKTGAPPGRFSLEQPSVLLCAQATPIGFLSPQGLPVLPGLQGRVNPLT